MVSVQRLVLHAGLPKTGTSSLQRLFHDHRADLRALDIDYPDPVNTPEDPKHDFLINDIAAGHCRTLPQVLARAQSPTVLLSIEGLSGRVNLVPEAGLRAFREATAGLAVEAHVVTRDPEPWVRSFWKQHALIDGPQTHGCGTALPLADFAVLDRVRPLVDHPGLARRLAEAYGATVISHDFADGLEAIAVRLLGLPEVPQWLDIPRIHGSISDAEMAVVLALNAATDQGPVRTAFRVFLQRAQRTGHEQLIATERREQPRRWHAAAVWRLLGRLALPNATSRAVRDAVRAEAWRAIVS